VKVHKLKLILFASLFALSNANLYAYSGISPETTLNLRINSAYSLTFRVGSYHFLHTPDYGWAHEFDELEVQSFLNYRLNPLVRFAIGYAHEFESDQNSHRTIQQVSLSQRIGTVNLSHRVRSEQTFSAPEPVAFRFRYRASVETPLQGTTLDPREFFMTTSTEILYVLQEDEREIENRTVLQLGYVINDRNRIQSGFDFRHFFGTEDEPYHLFFKVGYFINL